MHKMYKQYFGTQSVTPMSTKHTAVATNSEIVAKRTPKYCIHGIKYNFGVTAGATTDLDIIRFLTSVVFYFLAGHGAGSLDVVSGIGGRQAPVGVHAVRPRRRRANLSGRDDARRDGHLRTDGQIR